MRSSLRLLIGFSFGTWVNALINLISIPIITWLVNPVEFGKATMFTLAYNLMLNFVMLGADQSFARMFNEKDDEAKKLLFNNSLVAPLIFLSFFSLAIISFKEKISVALFSDEHEVFAVYALIGNLFVGILSQFGIILIRMKSRAVEYSVIQVLSSVGNVIFIIGYASFIQPSFEGILYGSIFSLCISLFISVYLEISFWISSVKKFLRIDQKLVTQILLYGLPFVPTFLVDWVFQSSDRAFLRIYSTYAEIGLFAAATKVANSLNIIKNGFTAYWVPFSYEKFSKNPFDTEVFKKYFNLLSLLLFPSVIVLISFSDLILSLLPDTYQETSKIFPVLFFVPLLYTLSEITVVGINFKKKPLWHFFIVIISSLTNVLFGFLLIPKFGALGAAVSTLIAYLVFFIVRSVISINLFYVAYNWSKFIYSLLITLGILTFHTFYKISYLTFIVIPVSLILITFLYRKDLQGLTRGFSFKRA